MTTIDLIHQLKLELWNLTYTQWRTETLFSLKWWILIALIIISYAIWLIIVDKRRLSQILLFGSLIAAGRIFMDIIGSNAALWSYLIREIPFFPSPFLHDFTLTPLALMIVYQYCHSWKKFIIWTIIATGIISFILFPILMTFGYLQLYNWNLFYSFTLIVAYTLLSRWLLLGVLSIEQKYK